VLLYGKGMEGAIFHADALQVLFAHYKMTYLRYVCCYR